MKRNTLTTAVLAGLTGLAGMASVSHAVNLNPDGLGQVLIYPYYTARGGNDTLFSVVNTTAKAKAVKVRFIEALNSREVLDFNLYLSPYDVWVAAITETDAGGGQLLIPDTSCTVPYFQGGVPGNIGVQPFLNFQYTGARSDGGPQGIERTASGYLEMIEMGTLVGNAAAGATHVGGVPASCALVNSYWSAGGPWRANPNFELEPVEGGLFGGASILNVAEGTMFSYNATAIDSFWEFGSIGSHTDPGSLVPDLNSGDTTSNVFLTGVAMVDTQTWPAGVFALNATLTFDELFNEYIVDPDLAARSEWVVTFPTKRFHTDDAPGGAFVPPGSPIPPFTRTWSQPACEDMELRVWDREEREPEGEIIISPPPPQVGFFLCREANVIRFSRDSNVPDQTEILKEIRRDGGFTHLSYTNFELPAGFDSGWVKFDLTTIPTGGSRLSVPANTTGVRYAGLPTVGFWVQRYTNGTLLDDAGTSVLSNYASAFEHRGSRRIVSD